MPFTLEQTESSTILQLQGTVDIASAAELKQILIDALGSGKPVRASLANATGLDVTAVQLLHAAERAALAAQTDFGYQGPLPERMVSALLQAGFENFPIPTDRR